MENPGFVSGPPDTRVMKEITRPAGVELIVSGTDVQAHYLATLVAGFSRERELWCLDYFTTDGDVRDAVTLPALLADLQAAGCHLCFVDSGFATDAVYAATVGRRGISATKGELGSAGDPVILPTPHQAPKGPFRAARYIRINTTAAKDEIAAMLGNPNPTGRNVVHIPRRLGLEFINQLTSEEKVSRFDPSGIEVGAAWKKKSASVRNEALDCAVLALAAFHSVTPTGWHLISGGGQQPRRVAPVAEQRRGKW
jgi:phage terminase large subunit GpA-like protein